MLTRTGTLYNNSPVETAFIAVLDSEVVGGMQGVDKSEGLAMACTGGGLGQDRWKEQGDAPSGETLINVTPMQVCSYDTICITWLHLESLSRYYVLSTIQLPCPNILSL